MNLYNYVSGDPVNAVDPSGLYEAGEQEDIIVTGRQNMAPKLTAPLSNGNSSWGMPLFSLIAEEAQVPPDIVVSCDSVCQNRPKLTKEKLTPAQKQVRIAENTKKIKMYEEKSRKWARLICARAMADGVMSSVFGKDNIATTGASVTDQIVRDSGKIRSSPFPTGTALNGLKTLGRGLVVGTMVAEVLGAAKGFSSEAMCR